VVCIALSSLFVEQLGVPAGLLLAIAGAMAIGGQGAQSRRLPAYRFMKRR
jgi:hypothetical protein